ncbi:MAG TPA: glutaredoxin family protein [Candidatus Aquicultor sp.]
MGYESYVKEVPGEKRGEIFLYALSTCIWCQRTKALLNELELEYKYVDVDLLSGASRDEAVADIGRCNPSVSFPTIRVEDNECIIGFQEDKIRGLQQNG